MGNVSSKLLGIFVQKRLRILYIPVKQSTDGGGGVGVGEGGGVKGLSKSTVGPRFLRQVMVPLPFVYFCHQSF